MAMKLLVVDDEPQVLRFVKTLLESLGYEVLGLTDSKEAARRVDREKFDGIFLDARMPEPDGFGLARIIRKSPSNAGVPIILLTGYDDVETMRAGFRAGITFFIAKPPDVKKLGEMLRVFHHAMLREKRSYVRLPLRTVVNCRAGSRQFTCASLNIGEGGMLLEQSGDLEGGQEIDLRFSLPPNPEVLNPRARVVRTDLASHMAVQFVDLSDGDHRAIQAYIAGIVKG
jgi:CheY-like chemotaxis protein